MADAEWIENLKKIVLQAMEAGDPCNIILGTVVQPVPLAIQIDQKTVLTAAQVIVPEHLTDHKTEMSIPGIGSVTAAVKQALKGGEKVILIQKQGGQQYAAIGRI